MSAPDLAGGNAVKRPVFCAFLFLSIAGDRYSNAGCWAEIDPIAYARQCPIIVRGTISRIEPGQPMGNERIFDIAIVTIDKVFKNTLGDEPTVKDGGFVRVLMVSKRNAKRVSTDLSYPVGTAAIWLIDIRPDAQLHIDLRPEQRQPLAKEGNFLRHGAFKAEVEKVLRIKGAKPRPAPTKAELLASRKEQERQAKERARAAEAAHQRVIDLASYLAAAPHLGAEHLRRFDQASEMVRRDVFNLSRDQVKLTGPNWLVFSSHMLRHEPSDNVRAAAASWLDATDKPQAALLRQAIKDRSEFVRGTACRRLQDCPEPGTAALVAGSLADKSWWVRMAAVDTLGRLGDRKQSAALLALFAKEGTKEDNVHHFAEALARLGETDASLDCVQLCLKSDNENVRHFGVLALGLNQSDKKVVPAAMALLAPALERTVADLRRGPGEDRVFVGLCSELRRRTGQKIGNDVLAWHDWWATARPRFQGPPFPIDGPAFRALQQEFRKLQR
jgi:hypothetical protein